MFSWDGIYLGSSFGYNFATMNEQALDPLPGVSNGVPVSTLTGPGGYQQSYSPRGVLTDFHVGYLKQFGNFVAGGEFDVGFSPSNTAKTLTNGLSAVMPGGTASIAGDPATHNTRRRRAVPDRHPGQCADFADRQGRLCGRPLSLLRPRRCGDRRHCRCNTIIGACRPLTW